MKHPRKAKHIRQKQREKRFDRWFAAGGIAFVLLGIGGILFWHSNQTPPEPITIYKAVPSSEIKQRQPSTPLETTGSASQTHHPDDRHFHESIPPEVSTDTLETAPIDDTVLAETDVTTLLELTDADIREVDHEETHIQLELIKEDILALNTEMLEKYPEVAKVNSLTPEEIRKKYPTQAAQAALQAKTEQMQEEYITKISDIMAHLQMDLKIEIIVGVSQKFADRYGDNAADEVTAQLMRSFGL